MATFNGGRFIAEQVGSILGQLSPGDELIVSDDGSTDSTLEVLERIGDPRIRVFSNQGSHGFKGNFENALSRATGDFVFLSDQDDVWLPGKVETVLGHLGSCDLVVHDGRIVDADGADLGRNCYSTLHSGTGFWANLWRNRFSGCRMAFTREVLQACLPFPDCVLVHDYWIGIFALSRFRVRFIPDILMLYRRHGGNASSSSERSRLSLGVRVSYRLSLLLAIRRRTRELARRAPGGEGGRAPQGQN